MRPAWVATGNTGHCLVSVSPEIVPLSGVEVGGPSVPVPTKVSENPPVTAIEFPEMTPVKVMVNGFVPPLDKLALMFPFVPVTDPVAVAENESGEQVSDDGQDTTEIFMLVGTLAEPLIEPLLLCARVRVKVKSAVAE
jgi:hypothetical protein